MADRLFTIRLPEELIEELQQNNLVEDSEFITRALERELKRYQTPVAENVNFEHVTGHTPDFLEKITANPSHQHIDDLCGVFAGQDEALRDWYLKEKAQERELEEAKMRRMSGE